MRFEMIKKTFSKIKKVYGLIRGFFPSALPIGLAEFETWSDNIISTYSLETMADSKSIKWTLALKALHLGETTAYKSNMYFYLSLRKAAANQVVSYVIQDLKNKEAAARASAAPIVEVTGKPVKAPDNEAAEDGVIH